MTDPTPISTQNYFEDALPNEIILYIFSFIPGRELVSNVSLVCKKFNKLLGNQQYWAGIIKRRYDVILEECEQKYGAIDARRSYVEFDEAKERWKSWDQQKIKTSRFHAVTNLMLFNKNSKRFCLTGCQDQSIRLWDVDNIEKADDNEENRWNVMTKDDAHEGWIWNIAKDNENFETFYTVAGDAMIKSWDIGEADIRETNRVHVESATQCVDCFPESNEIVCADMDGKVLIIDKRTFNIVGGIWCHSDPAIALAVRDNFIYWSGEDRLLLVVDRRFMDTTILEHISEHSFKTYLSIHNDQLLASGSDGSVSLFDASNLQVVSSYKIGDFTRQAIINRGAHLVMASQDREYKFSVHIPGANNSTIIRQTIPGYIGRKWAKFDYLTSSQTLAIGSDSRLLLFAFPQTSDY